MQHDRCVQAVSGNSTDILPWKTQVSINEYNLLKLGFSLI